MRKILSISVASYNVENTLKETVDSMLKCENVKELEIIIVNDGSKDKTLKIAENYKKIYPDPEKVREMTGLIRLNWIN